MIYIKTDDAQLVLKRLGKNLDKSELAKAITRSINASLRKSRTTVRKEAKRIYNISQKNLDGIDYTKASTKSGDGYLTGTLTASRKPIPLSAFNPKEINGNKARTITRKGVVKERVMKYKKKGATSGISIEVYRGKKESIGYAFMIAKGAAQVFARGAYAAGTKHGFIKRIKRVKSDGNDIPVKPLITLSTLAAAANKNVMGTVKREIRIFYPNELERQINLLTSL